MTPTSAGSRPSTRRASRCSSRPRRGHRAGRASRSIVVLVIGIAPVRVRLPRRPERRLAVRLAGRPGPGGAALHGGGGPDRGPLRSRSRCDDSYTFTGVGSDAAGVAFISAPARVPPADDLPLAVPDRVRAPGRCPRRRCLRDHACSPTRPPTCAASATRPRRSATRSRRASSSAGGSASTPARRAHLMRAQRDRDLSDESVATARLPPARRLPQRRLARPAAGRPELPVEARATLVLRERLLEPAPHECDAGAACLLTERRCRQRVRLEHDLLPLALEAAANDEERCMRACPPLVDLGE